LLLATSLVALLQLIGAALVWGYAAHLSETGLAPDIMVLIVSLAAGALVANVISVTIVVSETLMLRR